MPLWAVPILIVLFLALLLGIFALLSRIQNGRYLRPIVGAVAKIPFMRRLMMKASAKAIERDNPALASAVRKMDQYGTPTTPQQAQKLLSRLTPAERKAYMAAVGEQGAMPEPANRQQRRAMEKMQATSTTAPVSGKKKAGTATKPGKKGATTATKPGAKGKTAPKSSASHKSSSAKSKTTAEPEKPKRRWSR